MGRLRITAHAVERYHMRWAPHLDMRQVRQELDDLAQVARPTNHKTYQGQEVWVAHHENGSNVQFVVKRVGGERICVTILPETAGAGIGNLFEQDELLELLQESEENRRAAQELLDQTPTPPAAPKPPPVSTPIYHCESCLKAPASRYSRMHKKLWCTPCYEGNRRSGSVGRCPTIAEWELSKSLRAGSV